MKNLIILLLIFLISGCHSSVNNSNNNKDIDPTGTHMRHQRKRIRGQHQADVSDNVIYRNDTVFLPAGSNAYTRIKVNSVRPEEYYWEFYTTGVVKPLPGHMAEVLSPFSGRIIRSFVKLGQKISAGSPLFEVSSSEYLEAVKMCLQAKRERELAEKNYIRKKELADSGICSVKELDEAKLALDMAVKECEKTGAILRIYNINNTDTDLAQPLVIKAPISGEIVRYDIIVGQYIKPESEPIVTIADLTKIWVVARIKEKEIGKINSDDKTEVFVESLPGKAIKGEIKYIGDIMNQETRSVDVYIECENHDKILKPGMFATVKFYHKLKDAIIIPAASVLQDFNKTFLFEQVRPGVYVKREVSVISAGNDKILVQSGLEPGITIVTEGAIFLR